MLERFSRCCCGDCDYCEGLNPDEMTLTVPDTWEQSAYGYCDDEACNTFAGYFILDVEPLAKCLYTGPTGSDTNHCMWNAYTATWWYAAAWILSGGTYRLRVELYGNVFQIGTALFARWEHDFGSTKPDCDQINLDLDLTWNSAYFCTPPPIITINLAT